MMNPLAFDFAGTAQKLRDVRDLAGEIVIAFSVIANFIPKAEGVTSPLLKRVTGIVSFLALNWRTHLRGKAETK